jgi:hypothetical protein
MRTQWGGGENVMASYRIVCTDQEPFDQPKHHAHIVSVGTGDDPDKAGDKLTLAQVLTKLDAGDTFYTVGTRTGKRAEVLATYCSVCATRRRIIKSSPDATTDNNLDGGIRRCRWT